MPTSTCLYCGNIFSHGYSTTGKYCNSVCCNSHRKQKRKEANLRDFEKGTLASRARIREILFETTEHKCSVCNKKTWNGKPIPLWCDHIDGDATNNDPSNFRLICPNCDAQSATFGAKNYGKGRKSRGLPQYG